MIIATRDKSDENFDYDLYENEILSEIIDEPYLRLLYDKDVVAFTHNRAAKKIQRACHDWLWNPSYINPKTGNPCINVLIGFQHLRNMNVI